MCKILISKKKKGGNLGNKVPASQENGFKNTP